MAIIVTGASGQFGRALVEQLLARVPASELILTTRKPESLAEYAQRGASIRHADFDAPETLGPAFEGGDRMMLISTARVGTRVQQHKNAIDAARAAGVGHVVYTSILGAATPGNPAIVSFDHRATEIHMEQSGLAWTHLRDSQYAEAVAGVIAPLAILNGRVPGCAGEGRIAFVARTDCVACAAAVLTTPGHENKAYDITGPELWTFPKVIDLIAEMSGRKISYDIVTEEEMFAYFDAMGAPRHASDIVPDGPIPWSSDDMVSFEIAIRDGFFDVISDHVERLTGRKPRSLRQVLEDHQPSWPRP